MKALLRVVLNAVLSFMFFVAVAQSPSEKITLYTDDFAGNQVELGAGKYDNLYLARVGILAVKSVKIPAGMKVTIFERDNFEGGSVVLTDNTKQSQMEAKGFGKLTMNVSLIVEKIAADAMPVAGSYVTIYGDDFAGTSKSLVAGQFDFHDLGAVDNDQLSSVRIPEGMKVTLYEHGGFKGRSLALTSDTRAATLVAKKFNNITSSILVEQAIVEPVKKQETPVTIVPVQTPDVTTPAQTDPTISEPTEPLIYQGDFSGLSKSLGVGRYSSDQLGIGNNELSSIKVPRGFRVTLYDGDAFEGRSLVVTGDSRASFFVDKNFNNLASSIVVDLIPMVTIYEGDYSGVSARLAEGRYTGHDFGIGNDQLSSVRVPAGLRITLYEEENFGGRSLTLTNDSGLDVLQRESFNNETSSVVVELVKQPVEVINKPIGSVLAATIYSDDLSGSSARLGIGRYDVESLGIGNDMLSSITIPRGLQVTLYEHGAFAGRTMLLRDEARKDFLVSNNFNDLTSSIVIEKIFDNELAVTVYSEKFAGRSQTLLPGRYLLKDLTIGNDQVSSARVPTGMRLIMYEDDNHKGYSLTAERDVDLSISKAFDNRASSLIVEDVFMTVTTPSVVEPTVVTTLPDAPQPDTMPETDACAMTTSQFENAYKSVESKGFASEKMDAAKLVTKGRCLNILQIRTIAKLFMYEDQTLDFVKYAYDLCNEKSEYYQLEDVFKFMSTRGEFTKFLQSK